MIAGLISMDDFYQQMMNIGRKMEGLGWITGVESNRQDVWFNWTEKGKGAFSTFLSEMKALPDLFDANDLDFIRQNVFYLGIKHKSRKEVLLESLCQTYDLAGNEELIAESGGVRKVFSRLEIFDLLAWVYRHNENEVRIHRSGGTPDSCTCVMKVPAGVYQDGAVP
jgi:hypothetical protein